MLLKVKLPDGQTLEVARGATSGDVASAIGAGLARSAIGGRVTTTGQPEIIDLHRPLPGDCELTILTTSDDNPDALHLLRHSAAHVMAEAICTLFPDTKLVYGPALEDGFYYDIDLAQSITPEDFPRIEAEMSRIVKENRPFRRIELTREEGMAKLRDEGSRYKLENAERAAGNTLSFYVTGEQPGNNFEDLCLGPHVPATGVIKAFRIKQVSRSHYRGDINDQPLQRVYGTAFFNKSTLDEYFKGIEEAKKRDHRVLGRDLELFTISEQVGSGLVLWTGKGTIIRTELQNYLTGEMLKLGYDMVCTPHIGQLGLYRTSGHYPYYEESQFPAMFESPRGKAIQAMIQLAQKVRTMHGPERQRGEDALAELNSAVQKAWGPIEGLRAGAPLEDAIDRLYAALALEPGYLLKPMNCPHHIQIYASRPRSYRELPIRLGEYGAVYRFEQSGELAGLTRVRGFTQDDAHLFCTAEQLAAEVLATVDLTRRVLETLGLADYHVRLGMRDPASDKYVGSEENWTKAEAAVRQAAVDSGIDFVEEAGEAAFYGPKIDFVVKDCLNRKWQLGTVQVDYNLPQRFDLTYVGRDNTPHRPVMVHRTPFGSLERFVGILIEHFAGAFPLWLSPVQVAVATVSEKSEPYARQVHQKLTEAGLRGEIDTSAEKIGPKKQRLRSAKVNYILVVGEREAEERSINVNDRDGRTLGNMTLDELIAGCRIEVESKGQSRVAAG
ncbi:MAG: threonine--tRNA ligase [Planctomycetes bacterium]|nr:threonine--tRNA ligase [Planctomycetota bacterium]